MKILRDLLYKHFLRYEKTQTFLQLAYKRLRPIRSF